MVLLMIWRPRGLIGHRAPTVFLSTARRFHPTSSKRGMDDGKSILTVDHLSMRFGGIVAVSGSVVRPPSGARHRPDRANGAGKNHRVQLHHRFLQTTLGAMRMMHLDGRAIHSSG